MTERQGWVLIVMLATYLLFALIPSIYGVATLHEAAFVEFVADYESTGLAFTRNEKIERYGNFTDFPKPRKYRLLELMLAWWIPVIGAPVVVVALWRSTPMFNFLKK